MNDYIALSHIGLYVRLNMALLTIVQRTNCFGWFKLLLKIDRSEQLIGSASFLSIQLFWNVEIDWFNH